MAAVGAWPDPWAPYGCCGGVAVQWAPYGRREGMAGPLGPVLLPLERAGPLGRVWPLWGRGRSPGSRMPVVREWPVPWTPYGRRCGVAGPLGPVWLPWWRGRSPGPYMSAWGRVQSPGPRMAAVGRGLSPGNRRVAVGAWPVPWAPSSRRGGVDGPFCVVWPPLGRGRFPGLLGLRWGRGRFPGFRRVSMGAWLVT